MSRIGGLIAMMGAMGCFNVYNPWEEPVVYIRRPDTRYWRKRMEYFRRKANRFDNKMGDHHGHG